MEDAEQKEKTTNGSDEEKTPPGDSLEEPRAEFAAFRSALLTWADREIESIKTDRSDVKAEFDTRIAHVDSRKEKLDSHLKADTRLPRKPKPSKDEFIIVGKVRDEETNVGISGLFVQAFDKDHLCDDRLGAQVVTDSNGNFRISYRRSDFSDLFFESGGPDIYLVVKDAEGKELQQTGRCVHHNAGQVERFEINLSEKDQPQSVRDMNVALRRGRELDHARYQALSEKLGKEKQDVMKDLDYRLEDVNAIKEGISEEPD